MKTFFIFITAVLLTASVFAQTPEKMSYQAVIRDANKNLVSDKQVGVKISILKSSIDGSMVYTETHNIETNANGLVTVEIGGGNTSDNLSLINWGDDTYFIKTETDIEGGINYTIIGTSQLLSVPYALYAKKAENTFSGNYDDLANTPELWDSSYATIKNTPDLTIYATDDDIVQLQNQIDDLRNELINLGIGTVEDIDGHVYEITKIGDQIWMTENLKTTRYSDGSEIPFVSGEDNWLALPQTAKAYCWYNDDSATYAQTYGAYYTWGAVMNGMSSSNDNPSGVQGVCPTAWHVPSSAEWDELETCLGGSAVAGGKMKEKGTTHWNSPNVDATNESGFTALGAGYRNPGAGFLNFNEFAWWWGATETDVNSDLAYWTLVRRQDALFAPHGGGYGKYYGMSVRCVKD